MTKQVQRRRGTATQHTSFTGAEGELSVNTTNKSVHVHDNVTAGGFEAARVDMDNVTSSSILTAAGITATTTELNYVDGVTSSIQTQLDGKAGTASPTFTGTLTTANLTATGTTTLAGASTSADITFGDNDKAIFGAGSDLQIYHSGSNSHITEGGTGNLIIRADDFRVQSNAGEEYIAADANGAVSLRYDNAAKLATTSTGIDVTGTVTADGLTVDGNVAIGLASTNTWSTGYAIEVGTEQAAIWGAGDQIDITGNAYFNSGWKAAATKAGASKYEQALGNHNFAVSGSVTADSAITFNQALNIANNGDISFYEDTGTTAKFFWDASAERLGVGTASPNTQLEIVNNGNNLARVRVGTTDTTAGNYRGYEFAQGSSFKGGLLQDQSTDAISIFTPLGGESVTVTSSGNVGIGTSSPSQVLHVESSSVGVTRATIMNTGNAAAGAGVQFVTKNGATQVSNATVRTDNAGNFSIFTGTTSETERMRIGSGGVVDIKNVGSEASPSLIFGGDDDTGLFKPISNTLAFSTFGSEAMRIDSSGNLLVGKTSADNTTDGATLWNDGTMSFTANLTNPAAGRVAVFNRRTADGAIVDFRKDGSTVGSIGTDSDMLVIGSSTTNLNFRTDFSTPRIIPRSGVGSSSDGIIDLGDTGSRFKDLYLSGGVYLGGVGSANKLDDYEEGTWTPVIYGGTSGGTGTYETQQATYVKVGNLVHVTCRVSITNHTGTGSINMSGWPFASSSDSQTAFAMMTYFLTFGADKYPTMHMGESTSTSTIFVSSNNASWSTIDMDTSMAFIFNGTYTAA